MPPRQVGVFRRARGDAGLTLVELMVAAIVLGVSVTGVMSMLGIGVGLETEGTLRQQARRIAANALERKAFHYSSWATILPTTITDPSVHLVTVNGDTMPATLKVTVFKDTIFSRDALDPLGDPLKIPIRTIESIVYWDFNDIVDTVAMAKSLTEFPP